MSRRERITDLARRAMPLMDDAQRGKAEILLARIGRTENAETLQEFTRQAAAAFEDDMRPVVDAIVGALNDGDMEALRGLRALLPHLLEQVSASPALADLLAHQLGKAFLEGFNS